MEDRPLRSCNNTKLLGTTPRPKADARTLKFTLSSDALRAITSDKPSNNGPKNHSARSQQESPKATPSILARKSLERSKIITASFENNGPSWGGPRTDKILVKSKILKNNRQIGNKPSGVLPDPARLGPRNDDVDNALMSPVSSASQRLYGVVIRSARASPAVNIPAETPIKDTEGALQTPTTKETAIASIFSSHSDETFSACSRQSLVGFAAADNTREKLFLSDDLLSIGSSMSIGSSSPPQPSVQDFIRKAFSGTEATSTRINGITNPEAGQPTAERAASLESRNSSPPYSPPAELPDDIPIVPNNIGSVPKATETTDKQRPVDLLQPAFGLRCRECETLYGDEDTW